MTYPPKKYGPPPQKYCACGAPKNRFSQHCRKCFEKLIADNIGQITAGLKGKLIASAPALTTQLAGRDRRIAELEEIILIAKVALGNIAEDRLAISHKEYARGQRERIDEHLAALKGKL